MAGRGLLTSLSRGSLDAHQTMKRRRRAAVLLTCVLALHHLCRAHAQMVTSIESAGPLIVSGSTDRTVALWDMR